MTADLSKNVLPRNGDLRALTDTLRPQHAVVTNQAGEWILLRAISATKRSALMYPFLKMSPLS